MKNATTSNKNKKNNSTKKHPNKKKVTKTKSNKMNVFNRVKNMNKKVKIILILLIGLILLFSTYAWFSTNLNVKIRTFNMIVTRNTDLTISFDGINFDRSLEISKENILDNIRNTYPSNLNQWADNGLIPVSSPGITNNNSSIFDMYETSGVLYTRKDKNRGFVRTTRSDESRPRQFNSYLAFDIFIKNKTGSPIPDNLYFEDSTSIIAPEETDEEMLGLVNSFRLGLVKVGSVGLDAPVNQIQNISCNNACRSIIFEPNSANHTDLSIERAKKYGVELVDGVRFPTYSYIRAGGPIYVANSVSGSPNLNEEYFRLQETFTEHDFNEPLFQIPDGITKVRVYLWIEGQDIDSLETNSTGTEVEISLDFIKDQAGYQAFND